MLLAVSSACGHTCPLNGVASNKLVCLIPQVYGPFGFNFSSTTPRCSPGSSLAIVTRRTFESEVLISPEVHERVWRMVEVEQQTIPTKHEGSFPVYHITRIKSVVGPKPDKTAQ